MSRRRVFAKQALYVFFTVLLTGCDAAAAEPRKITVGYSSIGPMSTGVWMAKEAGAFEKHGIQADLIYIASGPVNV